LVATADVLDGAVSSQHATFSLDSSWVGHFPAGSQQLEIKWVLYQRKRGMEDSLE
jgi:hypothetical protein